ncbi:MAG: HEAT repeat domain-containing protein, partial [Planctomycetes bacterium]|nr:HEAT repeat domain-containing protein [Planctomycetota bacterium]
ATVLLAALGGGAISILAEGEFDPEPAASPGDSSPRKVAETAAPASSSELALTPEPEAPAPPGRSLEGSPDLPPLARTWRKAVLLSQRSQVMAGARALRESADGKQQLLSLMDDTNPRVRAFALRELGRRRDPSLAPELARFLTDPDPHVAENARWALDSLDGLK